MFARFKFEGARVYASKEDDGFRIEEYALEADGAAETKCVWGRTFTPEQATELKRYLESQGY